MKTLNILFFGIFSVMALSNAIVPVLPLFAQTSSFQGAIYAAYFFGAFASTLPGGILSDRYGHVPVIRIGLILTVFSGILLYIFMIPALTLVARFVEGLGTGLFVAAAMSYVNSHPDHERMSGYLMAMMNAGLVTGLVFSGWLVVRFTHSDTGIAVFTALVTLPAISSFLIAERIPSRQKVDKTIFFSITSNYRWLLYSTIILIGITGVLISLYPEFSDMAPDSIGIWIAVMSISTVLAVLIASRIPLPPVRAIQVSAILMAISILVSYLTPLGFIMIGILVGFVIISQMAFLSEIKGHQGIAMGLFSTSSYLGMAVLPFLTGLVAETAGFFWAYVTTAFLSMTVAATIGRCTCQRNSFS